MTIDTGIEAKYEVLHVTYFPLYLYFTKKIAETENEELKQELLTSIRNGSPVTWQHINLHGEYDFSDSKLQDSVGLNASEILVVK